MHTRDAKKKKKSYKILDPNGAKQFVRLDLCRDWTHSSLPPLSYVSASSARPFDLFTQNKHIEDEPSVIIFWK